MGDRVSIQFQGKSDWDKSPVLFSHSGGMEFVEKAQVYLEDLRREVAENQERGPLDRLEAQTVMVDFIRHLVAANPAQRIKSDLYLGPTEADGDNSTHGHHVIMTHDSA